jgi:hypothetical protein
MAASLLSTAITPAADAQPKPSFSVSYDLFPYQNFTDPPAGLDNAEILSFGITAKAAYPIIFSQGKTVLINEIYYQRREFNYKHFPGPDPAIDDIHAANYTLMLQHVLSQKWSMLLIVTPGVASDFEGDVVKEDFNFQTVAVFIRQISESLSMGLGAAYSTQFGEPFPLPILAIDWNNGKNLLWKTILPVSSELWYQQSEKVQLGLVLAVEGNNYHGDPDIYGVGDPQMRYSVVTVGPSARLRLSNWLQLQVDGGLIGYHRFEFFDGDDEVASFNLKPFAFGRIGLSIGG